MKKYFKIVSDKITSEIFENFFTYVNELDPGRKIKEKDITNPNKMPFKNLDRNIGYIYLENNKPIGMFFIAISKDNQKYLYNVFISPSYRGQNKCYQMIQEGINDVGKGILLKVKSDNIAAIKCYEKLGFEKINKQEMFLFNLKAFLKRSNKYISDEFKKRNIKRVDNYEEADIIWKATLRGQEYFNKKYLSVLEGYNTIGNKDKLIKTYSDKKLNNSPYINQKYFPVSIVIKIQNNFTDIFNYLKNKKELSTNNPAFQKNIWLLKPPGLQEGRGIYVFDEKNPPKSITDGFYVLQRYLDKPLLIDGRKFDMRMFILAVSNKKGEVKLYFSKLFFLRMSVKKYSTETFDTLIHLTNTFQQSKAGKPEEYLKTKEEINESQFSKIFEMVKYLSPKIKEEINPSYLYQGFQLIGIDVMLSFNNEPFLLEMNFNPSLDYAKNAKSINELKKKLISDVFKLTIDDYFGFNFGKNTDFIEL